jgi:peroxiredoxin
MKKLFLAACACAAVLSGQQFKLGSQVGNFTVTSVDGKSEQYSALKGDVTVVMFIATKCPVSNAYNDRMKAIYNDYAPKGAHFIFINANRTEPAAEVAAHAREHGFPFQVYKDNDDVVADQFGATVTPEAFVIDSSGTIRYHGSIDDSQEASRVRTERLRNALNEILAGQPVAQAETKAFGCTIKRMKKTS